MSYNIISFDIFQTLVDVNKRIPEIWRGVLKDQYTGEKASQGAGAILSTLPGIYENAVCSETFQTMETVYLECAGQAVKKLPFTVLPREVAYHLMFQHSRAPFYDEVLDCMRKIKEKYTVILSSDSNHLMVDGLLDKISYDKAFISDDLKSYKGDKAGRFFKTVLQYLNADPKDILHIGDSSADVLGAHKAGIASCWLNRDGRQWSRMIKPDFIIRNLNELVTIL